MEIEPNRLYTFGETLELVHLSNRTLLRLLGSGELHGAKFGREWRIKGADILDYYERRKQGRSTEGGQD